MAQNQQPTYIGPDYGALIQGQTLGAIMTAFVTNLLSDNFEFTFFNFFKTFLVFAIILFLKSALEESKKWMEGFSFFNINLIKWIIQRIKFKTESIKIEKKANKWHWDIFGLNPNFDKKMNEKRVMVEAPKKYYFLINGYMIKVIVKDTEIHIHHPAIKMVRDFLTNMLEECKEKSVGKTKMFEVNNYRTVSIMEIDPPLVFPCKNYESLMGCVEKYIRVANIIKSYKPFVANFDGPPGTGKTTFGSYAFTRDCFDKIIIVNMIPMTEKKLIDILNALNKAILAQIPDQLKRENVLVIFDEIDLYINRHIDFIINEDLEKSRQSSVTKDKEQVINFSVTKLTPEEIEEKKRNIRYGILDLMYNLIDGKLWFDKHRYFLIFNTNEYAAMFKDIGSKYNRLDNRIQKYNFNYCNREQIIDYFINLAKVMGEDEPEPLKILCEMIDPNVKLSYRDLYTLLNACGLDLKLAIKSINDFYQNEDRRVNLEEQS